MLKSFGHLWSQSMSHEVRLYAFMSLRNACAIPSQIQNIEAMTSNNKKNKNKSEKLAKEIDTVAELEKIIMIAVKAFCLAAKGGYNWRNAPTFSFMENCLIEMLKIDERTSYRIGYSCLRRMALVLRSSIR